ncbi:MAG: Transcription elongation factor GreA [Candidatus Moranbacteria bacterium GW2011_GWC2_37_73]|nr:MAG: Transcription elongation factor GreA [Parcubacteria group bacterium GW2011_GWC1_36_108]KKQ39940.1 MAG: Transcription elongation factor GreA [Candidatus Moranbacteria bacterium GW2011_GWC2_37_73]HAR99689.1 transcription elongation factor GreA [Candidatus Moranbacteria bacterium]HBU10622.1 transcription elongation factor GreA [Candidatus Moranbacteria bacterium]HCO99242.1 transcription elongation factor GreA [Candidatus Moranbacteria bacterium]
MVRFITKEGLKKLNEELDERKGKLRQEIAQAIKEAKEQGDLSENAEYAEAKSQQNENESRIGELEMVIKNSQVVERDDSQKGAQMSSTVKVKFNGSEMEFTIVGSNEADPANFKISNESPLGKAFMGHNAGDTVDVTTPKGVITYKIISVK